MAMQARLRDRGVEVIEFPFLTPERVAEYCFDRGFLQVCCHDAARGKSLHPGRQPAMLPSRVSMWTLPLEVAPLRRSSALREV